MACLQKSAMNFLKKSMALKKYCLQLPALMLSPSPFRQSSQAHVSNQMPPIYCSARFKRSNLTGVVPSGTWLTQDGHYVIIGGNGDSIYSRLMAAVGRPDMSSDNPLYANNSQRCLQEAEIMEVWGSLRTGSRVPVLGSRVLNVRAWIIVLKCNGYNIVVQSAVCSATGCKEM